MAALSVGPPSVRIPLRTLPLTFRAALSSSACVVRRIPEPGEEDRGECGEWGRGFVREGVRAGAANVSRRWERAVVVRAGLSVGLLIPLWICWSPSGCRRRRLLLFDDQCVRV